MRLATQTVWLWAIVFPLGWIGLMALLTEDGEPPTNLTLWVFTGIGLVIWVVGLLIAIGLRFLVPRGVHRRIAAHPPGEVSGPD